MRRRLAAKGWSASAVSVTEALRDEGLVLPPEAAIVEVVSLAAHGDRRAQGVGASGATRRCHRCPGQRSGRSVGRRRSGLERSEVCFPDEAAVRRLAQRLASSAGRRLDDSVPFIDARLPNGIRLHAILPPVSPQGTCLSLRVPRRQVFTLADLVEVGMIPQAAAPVLEGWCAGGRRSWSAVARDRKDHPVEHVAVGG